MYIDRVPNRNSPPAVLLREFYRQGGKVRKRTLANLTQWPEHLVEGFRVLLAGGTAVERLEEALEVVRSRPHGHVAAVLGTLRKLGLDQLLDRKPGRRRDLVVAMIVARLLEPRSKLATARSLSAQTASSSLGQVLGLGEVDEDELYNALDWLDGRQETLERQLAGRHLAEGTLVLYDLTSVWLEGRKCELAARGYAHDGKRGKLQIVCGMLCDGQGRPVAVEVFRGNTADPNTLADQIAKVKGRFGLSRVVLVGDRGMITEARIKEEIKPAGLDWITALRAPAIQRLAAQGGPLQLSLFDETDLAEITSSEYPGERLIVCKNPLLAAERRRQREELLQASEAELEEIVRATRREKRRLKGKDKIGLRVGRVIDKCKMAKHFHLEIGEDHFSYRRDEQGIAQEAALDGIYVIRTSVPPEALDGEHTVAAYKALSKVEQAFRSLKRIDLQVRPIHHRRARRVRAHVLLCMLAYYLEWRMRQMLAPILFDDHDPAAAEQQRASIVAPAQRSPRARRKAATKRTGDGLPVHSFPTLLADLATIAINRIQPRLPDAKPFETLTRPTLLQQRALDLLEIRM